MATVVAGAALGTTPPAPTVTTRQGPTGGGDYRGQVSLGTGTTPPANGIAASVTLAQGFNQVPDVLVEPGNAAAGGFMWEAVPTGPNTFDIRVIGTLAASQALGTYLVNYFATTGQPE